MRLGLVRTVDIRQALPMIKSFYDYCQKREINVTLFYLEEDGYIEGVCDEVVILPKNIPVSELAKVIIDKNIDKVMSISIPDDAALRDSILKSRLKLHNIPMLAYEIPLIEGFSNKAITKRILQDNDIPTTYSKEFYGEQMFNPILKESYDGVLEEFLGQEKFPIIVKALFDSMSIGIFKVNNLQELKEQLNNRNSNCNILMEKFIEGNEVSVEVYGINGVYETTPLVAKNGIDRNLNKNDYNPFQHIRICPAEFLFSNKVVNEIKKQLIEFAKRIKLSGNMEVELIIDGEEWYVYEVNPRVSGLTNLTSFASGTNRYVDMLNMLLGDFKNRNKSADKIFAEVPIIKKLDIEEIEYIANHCNVHSTQFVEYHDGSKGGKIIVSGLNVFDLADNIRFLVDTESCSDCVQEEFRNLSNYLEAIYE